MIPKPEFVKLRKAILEYLRRNSEANGYCHIRHESLDKVIMYSGELRPFVGMGPEERAVATDRFWECLSKAGLVLEAWAPVDLEGREAIHYYLPGTKPFHDSSEALFERVRRESCSDGA